MRASWLVSVLVLSLATACTSRSGSESDADRCSNGMDDDGDGLIDCRDPACSVHAWCSGASDAGMVDAGPPIDSGPRPDGAACTAPLDVTFVIDVSTSMTEELSSIRDGMGAIWDAATALTPNTQFTLVVFVDDALAVSGCAPFTSREALQSELDTWREFCASNRSPASDTVNTDCPENSLDALYLAATTCPWRSGSTRVLVHVTDDTFVERPGVLSGEWGGGVFVMQTYDEVQTALVSRQLRVGAFAMPGAGEECGAGSSPNVGQGFHEGYGDNPSLPEATGGRAWDLREVRAGRLSMADAIIEMIRDEYCTLF